MKIVATVKFLNKETKVSKATGKDYINILLMQGTETLSCLSEVDVEANMGQEFTGIFELNTKYKNLKLVGVDKDGGSDIN